MLKHLKIACAALLACAALAGCGKTQPGQLNSLKGLVPDLAFHMTDDNGRPVTAKNYLGKIVLLYFGYTNCPDTCPATLARLAQALRATRDHGAGATVLFVTVDPKRDSISVMHDYVHAFGPEFVGLRGTRKELVALTKRYRVTYSYGKPDKDGNYEVTHSTGVFVFDKAGRGQALIMQNNTAKQITAAVDHLEAEAS